MVSHNELERGAATGVLLVLVALVVLLAGPMPAPAADRPIASPAAIIVVATPTLGLSFGTPSPVQALPTEGPPPTPVEQPAPALPLPTEVLALVPVVQQEYSPPPAVAPAPPAEVPPTELPPPTPATYARNGGRLVVVRDRLPERQEAQP